MIDDNKVSVKRLNPTRLSRAAINAARIDFRAIVENGTTKEDVLNPEFWSLVAPQFKNSGILPRIEIFPDDVSWLLEAVIKNYSGTFAVIVELKFTELLSEKVFVDPDDEYKIIHGGAHSKYKVVDKSGKTLRDGMEVEEANVFLQSHKRVMKGSRGK